ncbi:hypothetical protein LIER_24893 [Lithospermum erythrorhizon]|uniref:Uncharacterized protein n=1 Tax=Lithospermum erythrorhizon TaxID=34254 RepID=A0AAV3R5Z0_LITER
MASISPSNYLQLHNYYHKNPIFSSPYSISLSFSPNFHHRCSATKTTSAAGPEGGFLRKPVVPTAEVVDWEDKILEDTVPLVGFVRMILHSGKYESGDKLSPEHQRTILERLLPYHPECEKKIGSGVDYITIGYHPGFERSRCLFIARKDGELVDFSYWKCIKGLIRKNYPLYADSFILRHFRKHKRKD